MPIGIGAAMLIGSAVTAGSQVASAVMQSKASGKAVAAQGAALDKAQQYQQDARQAQLARLAPYSQGGAQAAGLMGDLMGPGQPPRGMVPPPTFAPPMGPMPTMGQAMAPPMPPPPPNYGGGPPMPTAPYARVMATTMAPRPMYQ